jgi:hypothetical protein
MTPFLKIKDACAVTGLSQYYLRQGCKDGTIPHIVSGGKGGGTYYIDVPRLLEMLRGESAGQTSIGTDTAPGR